MYGRTVVILLLLLTLNLPLLATVPTKESVAKLYIATFKRAPDSAGLEYWVQSSGLSLEGIAKSFFDQRETKALYPEGYSNEEFIKAVYNNLFDRAPESAGAAYWKKELDSSKIERSTFILAAINGALGEDATLLENRTEAGLYFAQKGLDDMELAKSIMAIVSADSSSVADAMERIDKYLDENEDEYGDRKEDTGGRRDVPPPNPPKELGWYMRTIVEARNSEGRLFVHKSAGVFGEYSDSSDGRDRHDIAAMGTAWLRVVFVHPDWEVKYYYSDYRHYNGNLPSHESWAFEVKNDREIDLSQASLKIVLEGPIAIFEGKNGSFVEKRTRIGVKDALSLVDIDEHKIYSFSGMESITLSMDGKHTRSFRWVIGSVTQEDMQPIGEEERAFVGRRSIERGFGAPPAE